MKRFLLLLLLTLSALATFTCFNACSFSRPRINEVNPAFGQYISAYTSGMISRKTTVRIELAESYYNSHPIAHVPAFNDTLARAMYYADKLASLPDSTLLDGIFSFEPAIKGKTIWVSDRIIEFIPEETLPPNQLYSYRFALSLVKDVPKEFREFHGQFSTYPQNLFVTIEGLRAYDEYEIELQKLTGKISTSDYSDTSDIRKCIRVMQNGHSLPVVLNYSYNNNEYYFYVDGIERKEIAGKVSVSWNGESLGAKQYGNEDIIVPGLGDFSVTDARVVETEDQYIELSFSDPLRYDQNLKGIVSIKGVDNLTFAIEGNVLKAFLPGRISGDYVVSVSTGIKNFKGYKMNAPYSSTLTFSEAKPMVRIKGNGTILPNSNGLIFPFESISLKAVDLRVVKIYEHNVHQFLQVNDLAGQDGLTRVGKVLIEKKIDLGNKDADNKQWSQHVIDLGKLISPDPGAIYRVSIKFRKEYALCDCETENETNDEETSHRISALDEDETWNENDWHGYGFEDGYDSWHGYYDNYSPCENDYYYGKAVSRNILASDIGLIYKLDDNKFSHAFVTNMITAKPIAGAQIIYYDYTKQLIASGTTDANGMLDIQLKRKPFLMLAKYGKQRGYLKLLDGEANSLSKFDVSGEAVQKGIKGFIYGERGVWRPGDSLYLTFILEDKEKRLPLNHPVKFELQDPKGQIICQRTRAKNTSGMYDFRTATTAEAITGNYTAVVRIGNRSFSQTLKVETVKPNRLKIYMQFEGGLTNDSIARLSAKWLHGATAKNLRASVNVSVNQMPTAFEKYRSYCFDSPVRTFHSDADLVFDGPLDPNGEAIIKTQLDVGQTAPGMLRATYVTKVFEEGGDFSIDRHSKPYSPYKTYVGLRAPEQKSYDHTYETGNAYRFDLATVDAAGKPVDARKLQVKIYKIQWRWWYERGHDEELATYISRPGSIVMKDTLVATTGGKGSFVFRVNYPEYGRYLVTVNDLVGGHETGQIIYVDWPYWSRANRSNSENANMLNFSCDREQYTTGDPIKLSFPSPSNGMALVSVESGTRVVKKFWIETKKGETVYQFPATGDMAPNAFIHVSLIQPHANTKNDLPIRMYGVVPITVDNPASHLTPEIRMADVLKPESTTSIRIKEKNGRKMTYTLAMVDEGLLDLTQFRTPQPWSTFYAREALGVKTWDMYDAVIGAYAGKLDKLLSVGGDGDGTGGKGIKANRFKPMVTFAGPFSLEAGAEKTHRMEIPNYVGSVRVMVVAEQDGAYGNAEKAVAVRKPLMILATLPRVLSPGETVGLPVNVFAMEDHVKDVKLEIETNDLLRIDGNKQQQVHFTRTGDEVVNFKLNVVEKTGIAKVKITAMSGKEKATQEIELDVRTPNPKVSEGFELVLEAGQEKPADIIFKGISGTNKATIEFSSIPPLGIGKRLDYLIEYPHGCIEQTTSSVFPQLYVSRLIELNTAQQQRISKHIKAGLKRLQLFQTSNGGFAYWPGEVEDSEWGSNYAGHFMIEAEKQGYVLPPNLKARWLKYQQNMAKNWSYQSGSYQHPHGIESHQTIQAYRLFVLALAGQQELGAMNRLREEKTMTPAAKWRLAAAYKLIGQQEVAEALIKDLPLNVPAYKELSYSYGSDIRDEAMILETLSLLKDKTRSASLAKQVAKHLNSDSWMSTQETAYSLLAMCEYAGLSGGKRDLKFAYRLDNSTEKNGTLAKSISQIYFSDQEIQTKGRLTLKNTGDATLFVKVVVEGVPLTGDKTKAERNLNMTVIYKNMKGEVIQPDRLVQGTDFMAVVTISNPGTKGYLREMALNQMMASGWEIHNSRMDESGAPNPARYQDIRDDRVYSYYELRENTSKTFVIQLNATYLGKFYLPTVYTEAMYDHLIHARVPGRWVEVVKDGAVVANSARSNGVAKKPDRE